MSHHHYEDVIDPETGKTYAQTKEEKKMKGNNTNPLFNHDKHHKS